MVWAPRVKAAEVVQPKPLLPPKARPQTGAASVPMGRKTSGGSHPAASRPPKTTTTGTSHSRGRTFQTPPATFVPIAAKQLPNRVPTMPAVRRDNPPINAPTMPAAMRLARANATNHGHNATLGMSAAPSGSVSGSADARWGVSVQSATYAQHAPSEDSEEDELEEPQHDPEDNFTWQAVREKLNNAQISNEHPSSRPTAPANNETDQFVGAEIIPEPHGAPSGGSFLPTRHISVTPSRPVSSVVYRGPVGDSAADTSAEELTCTGYTSVPLSHGQGGPAVDHASVSFVPSGSPQGSGRNLFRPASPSHTRHAPPNNVNVQRVHTSQREPSPETHDMPEPELPAEDPWDLEPEPGFEPFFASAENVTSDTSALRRQVTRRPLSSRDIEARVARSDALQREPNRHEEKGKGVSRHSSRASSLALSGSDMDISDASNSTVPSGSARTAVQQSAEAAGNAPAVRKSKSRMRKERKRAKAAKRAAKNAALLRPELQGLEDEQIAHRQVLQEKEILGVRDQVKQKGEEKQQEIGKRNQKQAKSQEQTNKLDKENGGMAKRSDKDIRHASNPRVRSPSVECLNPIRQLSGSSRPTSHSQETNIVSDSMAPRNNKASNVDSDDDGNVPLRMLHSSPVRISSVLLDLYASTDSLEIYFEEGTSCQ